MDAQRATLRGRLAEDARRRLDVPALRGALGLVRRHPLASACGAALLGALATRALPTRTARRLGATLRRHAGSLLLAAVAESTAAHDED